MEQTINQVIEKLDSLNYFTEVQVNERFEAMAAKRGYNQNLPCNREQLKNLLMKFLNKELKFYGDQFQSFMVRPSAWEIEILILHQNGFNAFEVVKSQNKYNEDVYHLMKTLRPLA